MRSPSPRTIRLRAWSAETGISVQTLRARWDRGERRASLLFRDVASRRHWKWGRGAERTAWHGMINRCTRGETCWPGVAYYRGLGIEVCRGWRESFDAFYEDMGRRPSKGHSIDRVDGKLGYHCGRCEECRTKGWAPNCRWATREEQASNRSSSIRVERGGRTLCLAQWARELRLPHATLLARWHRGDRGEFLFRPADAKFSNRC